MNKNITHITRASLRIMMTGLFALVFYQYYSDYTVSTPLLGTFVYTFLWYVIYHYICTTYHAFRIMSMKRWELVLIQTIAFGIADLLLYGLICISARSVVNIIPGALTVCAQIFMVFLIIFISKKTLSKYSRPKIALFITGSVSTEDVSKCLRELKEEHADIVYIKKQMTEEDACSNLSSLMSSYESFILFGVSEANRSRIVKECYVNNREFYFTPSLSDLIIRGSSPRHITETPMMKYDFVYEKTAYQKLKRILDIFFACIITVITSPIMLVTALLIRMDGGPALFVQKRYGKDGKVFNIYKFRSMVVDADSYGVIPTGEKDPRITKIGAVIRRTRIDELPQLFNILKGDMSFVGPRPERIEHIDEYSKVLPEFLYRLKVQQGLTGYAQVYGKYNTSPYDKVRLDMQYIENQSLLTDTKLILLTIQTLFKKESTEGFSQEDIKRIHDGCEEKIQENTQKYILDEETL